MLLSCATIRGDSVVECESDLRATFYSHGGMKVVSRASDECSSTVLSEKSGDVGKYVGRIQISVGQEPRGSTERERRRRKVEKVFRSASARDIRGKRPRHFLQSNTNQIRANVSRVVAL